MHLWWSLYTLYLLVWQVELPWAIQVFVTVSYVCRALLFPFVCSLIFFFVCAKSLTFSFYFDLFYVLDELVLRMLAALKQRH